MPLENVPEPVPPKKETVSARETGLRDLEMALSFDDVLLEPGYSAVLPNQVKLDTQLGPLNLRVPVLAAAMDTVTEARTAIALALIGGLAVLHKNCSPQEQAQEVRRVKKFQHAVIASPIVIEADRSIEELRNIIDETRVTGFPVVDAEGKLVGMCTKRDVRYVQNPKLKVSDVMSSKVLSLPEGTTREDAIAFFQKNKFEKLPLVDKQGRLRGLITSRDLRQSESHPHALRDSQGSLCVAAAVGAGATEGVARSAVLVEAGVDALVVDSAHGHSEGVLQTVRDLRARWPHIIIVGGNVGTPAAARALAQAGANVVKVGIGPGSICTTRIVSGAGMPQFTAVREVAHAIRREYPEVGVIADGGIRYSGDITKALAAGAHAVMLGSLFAGTDESPGDTILYQGRSYKSYRGMGSLGAMKRGSKDRYFQGGTQDAAKLVPEGVEARVPYRGKLSAVVHQLMGGLRAGMGYVGAGTLPELYERAVFRRISPGALKESHVHGVTITAEAPNYTGGTES